MQDKNIYSCLHKRWAPFCVTWLIDWCDLKDNKLAIQIENDFLTFVLDCAPDQDKSLVSACDDLLNASRSDFNCTPVGRGSDSMIVPT